MVLTLGALAAWKLLDPRRYVPYSRNRERIFQPLDPRRDGILEKVGSASLISALALSGPVPRVSLPPSFPPSGHPRVEEAQKVGRQSFLAAGTFLVAVVRDTKKRIASWERKGGVVARMRREEGNRCMSEGCFTSQLLETLGYRCEY